MTPSFGLDVVKACQDQGLSVLLGVSTATEIQMALESELTLCKHFLLKD